MLKKAKYQRHSTHTNRSAAALAYWIKTKSILPLVREYLLLKNSVIMLSKILFIFVIAVFAFGLSAICGGGASLILIPMIGLLLPVAAIPFTLTLGTFSSSVSRIVIFRKNINWRLFWLFVPASIPAVMAGVWLIRFINPLYLQLAIALFLLSNLYEFFKPKKIATNSLSSNNKKQSPISVVLIGILTGLVSGITGAAGLLFNRFYLNYGLKKEEIIATRAANEVLLHFVKIASYLYVGAYTTDSFYLGVGIALASVLSSWVLKYLLPVISERTFRVIGYAAMSASGVFLLLKTSQNIIVQDNILVESKGNESEIMMNWRDKNVIVEYDWNEGLEIEKDITQQQLPNHLQEKYKKLLTQYDKIALEQVFILNYSRGYEFYCYKNNTLTKFEFDEN
ncbi:hypothetical protein SAMN05421780_10148 [Flexibacter flexilis DSM 6793]|uniref:Probable membrane transporter protein n=1 Tax=Flexibacter flexilis DSM 6793 TaxID=927664 RepID=A0A1I1DDX1_9BACT|nr:sulfite exporter TauE/SafE family protein [Flexibacter flexilis]SFB71268.1 hypothetical protein SAMN05421780_10148 [Flexibacter flexilis DSM 6793]